MLNSIRHLKRISAIRKDELCDTCKDRLDRNPMRILDCKIPVCSEIAKDAPVVLDYLCDECKRHFEQVQNILRLKILILQSILKS